MATALPKPQHKHLSKHFHSRSSSSPDYSSTPSPSTTSSPSSPRRRLIKRQSGVTSKADLMPAEQHERDRELSCQLIQDYHISPSSRSQIQDRPHPTLRNQSFQKRHASFDSPREIPLPSPYPGFQSDSDPFLCASDPPAQDHPLGSSPGASNSDSLPSAPPTPPTSSSTLPSDSMTLTSTTVPTPVPPFSRPYSLPHTFSSPAPPHSPNIDNLDKWPDRSSSASLPLPMQTPFYTLTQAEDTDSEKREKAKGKSRGQETRKKDNKLRIPPTLPENQHAPHPGSDKQQSSPSPSMPTASASLPLPPPTSASYPTAIRLRSASASALIEGEPSYPAPDPPQILPQEAPRDPAPFLSPAPPPQDSWITVETNPGEYRLVVRLPGYRRDGITLATRRRRILHVVADSWEPNGGHFERRISFGYDADLAQVRAEFDGELLRVHIPRRVPPVNLWYGNGGSGVDGSRPLS